MVDRGVNYFKLLLNYMSPFLREEKKQRLTYYQLYHESIRDWLVTTKANCWDQGHAALFVLYVRVAWTLGKTSTATATTTVVMSSCKSSSLSSSVETLLHLEASSTSKYISSSSSVDTREYENRLRQELERFSSISGGFLGFRLVQMKKASICGHWK